MKHHLKKHRIYIAMILLIPVIIHAQLGLVRLQVTQLDDAEERMLSEAWLDWAETGEQIIQGLEVMTVVSPDGNWVLFGKPNQGGLDVVTYHLYLLSLDDFNIRDLADEAMGVSFSPASNYLFIATGPNPVVFDLANNYGIIITDIRSGFENYPVWVSEWSPDGKELVVHQQQRFDERTNPEAWRVMLP